MESIQRSTPLFQTTATSPFRCTANMRRRAATAIPADMDNRRKYCKRLLSLVDKDFFIP